MKWKCFFVKFILSSIVGLGLFFVSSTISFAADGSGTSAVLPTNVIVNSTGNVLNFTVTAAETMDSGGFTITVPSGWSTPNSTPSTAGYTTITSASGIVASVLNTLDSITGWSANQHMTLSTDTGDKQEGTGSLSNAITTNAAANEQWYFNYGGATSWGTAANGSNGQRVGMWIKSSVNTASGDLSWRDDNTASLASPEDTLAIAALTANTWKYTSVTLGAARTTQRSYGVRYTTDLGAASVKLDSISVLFDAADVATNWTGDTNITPSLITGAGNFMEGTGSIRCTYAATAGSGASGECYRTATALTILPGNKVSFWVRSSVALNAGDFAWVDDNSTGLNSITDTVSLPALSANTWTYVTLSIPNLGVQQIRSYGLRQVVDKGALTIDIDAMGSLIDYGDTTTGWTAPTSALQTLSLDGSVIHEGTGSLKNVLTAGATAGDSWYQTLGATQNWSGYTTVGFWIRSTVSAASGNLQFVYDDASDVSSPIGSINIGALSAGVWTYQKLTLTGTRTTINSFGIKYVTNIGATTINVDDILIGPGSMTFPGGGVINTRILGLTSPQTMVVAFGDGGGLSGVTAPSTTGNNTFTTKTKTSDSGTLTNISSQPVVSVDKITTTTALLSSNSPEVYGTSVTFTATVTPTTGGPATGTVTFKDGINTIGTGTLNSGVALYSTSTLSVLGSPHVITAVYGGDTNFSGSTSNSVSQTIIAKALTVTGMTATTKEYDGGITATLTGGSLVGIISPDVVSINTRVGTFATKTIGTAKPITVTSVTLTGADSSNYTVTNPTDVTGDITVKTISTAGVTADDKFYDGNDTAIITITGSSLVGVISGDIVTLSSVGATATFNNSNVGLDKPVTIIGLSLLDTDAINYNLTQPSGITASIRYPVPVTTSINPTSKESGESGFTLTVNGSGFVGVSTVKFNGSSRATTFVGSNQLTSEIPASDLLVATTSALITVTNPAPGGGTSNAQVFVVAHAATQFVILPPTNGTVDGPVVVTVQAQKANGTIDSTFQDDVTLNANGSATGDGLVNISNGEGTLTLYDHVAETVHLTLTDSQNTLLTVSSSQDFVFAPGDVTQFILNNPSSTMNARTRLGYQITRKDQYNNSVLTGALTSYLYSNSTSTHHAFYSDSLGGVPKTSIDFSDGSATASFWYYDDKPGTYTLIASDHTPSSDGLDGIDDAFRDVTVIPVAVKFVIIAASSASVDSPLTVTVQAQKVDNFVDESFQEDVTLSSTGSVTGEGLVEIVNGVGTKQLSNTLVEGTTFSLSDTEGTDLDISSTANVSWTGGVTTQVTLSHPVIDLPAGTRTAYTLTRKDQHGNVTSLGETTVYLYSSSVSPNKKFYNAATEGGVITSVVIHDGSQSVQFWYYDEALGTWSITASDGTPIANGSSGISDAIDVLTVVTGPVSSFTLSTPGNMTAKTRLGYTVTRKDQFGNLVTSGDTIIYLSTSAGTLGTVRFFYDAAINNNSISSRTISDGSSSSSFWYYEETSGTYTVTASDVAGTPDGAIGIVDGTREVVVSPAPIVATRFVILPPSTGSVDSPLTITIQAQDDDGSIDTTATSSVMLVTNGSATGAGLVTIIEGQGAGTIPISDHTAETVHLSLLDTENTYLDVSSTEDAVFTTGALAQFSIDNPGDTAAGSRLGFTITRKDQFGNLITSGITTAHLSSSSLGENKKFYDSESGGTVITAVNFLEGHSTAFFWYYDELAGSATVTVSASGIADIYRTFTVAPAAIAKFTLDDPGNMTQRTRLPYVITRKDAFNNLVTSGIVSAYLYSNSTGTSTAKFYDVVAGGSPIGLVSFVEGSAITHFWYYDENPGTWVVTASDGTPIANGIVGLQDAADSVTVTIALINATRFVIHPVNDSTVNTPVTVTVRAEDDSGSVDTTYNQNVTLVTSGSSTGGGLITIINGVGTATINDSVAEVVTLSLVDTLNTGLNISSSQTFSFIAGFVPPTIVNIAGETGPEYLTPIISGIRFSGKAFPGASLNIVAIGGTNSLINQKSTASTNGNFSISFGGLTSGATSYGIVGTDKNNNTTQVKIFDANKANALLQLDVNGILLSPTIGLSRNAVTKGDVLGITGAGAPTYKIEVQVDNQPITVTAKVDSKGMYTLLVPTMTLGFGSHTIRTRQISPSGLKSDYSPQEVFSVVNIFTPNMDFNGDGTIGVSDYSIFVSRWQSTNPKLKAKDDLNGDGKVDIQDLSIFVKTLKK